MNTITPEAMLAARKLFAASEQACIDEVLRGEVRVNNREEYFAWRRESIAAYLAGQYDHTFALRQRAWFIQTGECVPLLSK